MITKEEILRTLAKDKSELRHRIVHEYFGVDLEIIWRILQKDLPELRRSLSQI